MTSKRLREILLHDILPPGATPAYRRERGPAYVWAGRRGVVQDDAGRVLVPLFSASEIDLDAITNALLIEASHSAPLRLQRDIVDWTDVRDHFDLLDLRWACIVKHPDDDVVVGLPGPIEQIETPLVARGRCYCTTTPELLGRLLMSVDLKTVGVFLHNASGVLTVILPDQLEPSHS